MIERVMARNSSNINCCIFTGNAVRDPEIRVSSVGTVYATFSLAVNNRVYDAGSGEFVSVCAFIDLIAFGDNAEYVRDHVRRGSKVYVETALEQSMYRDREGKIKRSSIYRVNNIDWRGDGDGPEEREWTSPQWF